MVGAPPKRLKWALSVPVADHVGSRKCPAAIACREEKAARRDATERIRVGCVRRVVAFVALVALVAVAALGTWASDPSLTSAPVRELFTTFAPVTAFALIFGPVTAFLLSCFAPTLFLGSA